MISYIERHRAQQLPGSHSLNELDPKICNLLKYQFLFVAIICIKMSNKKIHNTFTYA